MGHCSRSNPGLTVPVESGQNNNIAIHAIEDSSQVARTKSGKRALGNRFSEIFMPLLKLMPSLRTGKLSFSAPPRLAQQGLQGNKTSRPENQKKGGDVRSRDNRYGGGGGALYVVGRCTEYGE